MNEIGAGIAAFGFWLFIGSTVVAGIWESVRKREAQHETLRRMIEAGQTPAPDQLDPLFGRGRTVSRDLRIGGLITLSVAPGLALLGWFISTVDRPGWFPVMLGVAGLVAFVGGGLLLAARLAERDEPGARA